MTSYVSIPNGDIDQDSPITQPLMTALRDNPIAIAEADATAPVNTAGWYPYNKAVNNDANTGVIWSMAVDGAVAVVTSPDYEDGYDYAFLFDRVQTSSAAINAFRANHYRETGAAYAGVGQIMVQSANNTFLSGVVHVMDVRLTRAAHIIDTVYASPTNTLTNSPTGVRYRDGAVVTHATPQKILRTQFSWAAGNIQGTNAAIYMFRRRSLAV